MRLKSLTIVRLKGLTITFITSNRIQNSDYIKMASSLPELPPFDPDEDPSLVPLRWKRYLRNVDMSLLAADIADHKRRWAYLLRW